MRRLTVSLMGAAAMVALAGNVRAEIVIAVAGPITGANAQFGEQMRRGAELAVKEINAAGGIDGEELALRVGDDACDPKQAVAVANQMANEDVVFVAGHFCSSSSIPASSVYNEEGILQITPASTNPQLTEQGFENVFRTCGRDDVQGIYSANYLVDNKLGSKVAIIHDKSAYGKGLADEFKKQLNTRGVQEVMYEAITAGERDFSALITKMKGAGVDLMYLGGYHTEAGLLSRQSREQGFNVQIVSADALATQEFWNIAGQTGEGFMMTFPPDPRLKPTAAAVVEKFKADGYDPEGYTLYTYAAVQIFAEAAKKAGSTELDALIETLRGNDYETAIGPIGFNEKGDIKAPEYVMYRWTNGTYAQIQG